MVPYIGKQQMEGRAGILSLNHRSAIYELGDLGQGTLGPSEPVTYHL